MIFLGEPASNKLLNAQAWVSSVVCLLQCQNVSSVARSISFSTKGDPDSKRAVIRNDPAHSPGMKYVRF